MFRVNHFATSAKTSQRKWSTRKEKKKQLTLKQKGDTAMGVNRREDQDLFSEDLVMFPSLKIAKTCKGYKDWLAWEDMEMEGRAKDAPKAERKL